jgi:hypothetical protein
MAAFLRILSIVLLACSGLCAQEPTIAWLTDLDQATRRAKATNRPLMIVFR